MTNHDAPPCETCGLPHRENVGGGFYADNGHGRHAYKKPAVTKYPTLAVVPDPVAIGDGVPAGYEYAVFGGFYRCCQCRALLERHDPELEAHSEHHARVDRALAEAWRLLNGGGAA